MIKQKQIKDLWYRLIKECYRENISNTNTTIRWNVNKREIGF